METKSTGKIYHNYMKDSTYEGKVINCTSDTSVCRTILKEKIQKIYEDSHQNYGAPKITAELQKSGERVSEKTVGNYMCQMGIKAQWVKP